MRHLVLSVLAVLFILGNVSQGKADIPHVINYQGRLTDNTGVPVDTTISITFSIHSDTSAVSSVIWTEAHPAVTVSGGLFTILLGSVTPIPNSVFDGSIRGLGMQIGSGPVSDSLIPIVSIAYAYRAGYADTAGYAFAAPGGSGGSGWIDDGNVVRLEKDSDSVGIGTASPSAKLNVVGDVVITNNITVGNSHTNTGNNSSIGGGTLNTITGDWAVIGGGNGNEANQIYATISGGSANRASGTSATISGGTNNIVDGLAATVGGGMNNYAISPYSTVAGGNADTASGYYSAVIGGFNNRAGFGIYDTAAFIGGGVNNRASAPYASVIGGKGNSATFSGGVVAGGENNEAGSNCFVGGGSGNTAYGDNSVVLGGSYNDAGNAGSVVIGGISNSVDQSYNTIVGGSNNNTAAVFCVIMGGAGNVIPPDVFYSVLIGINGSLTKDSTFMVDMPHIRFGNETTGYEFPSGDGSSGQFLSTDGSGQLSWTSPGNNNNWSLVNDVLYTNDYWGLSRGQAGNIFYGSNANSMVNLGTSCVTGTNGFNFSYATVSGGNENGAQGELATVGGGQGNYAIGYGSVISGGFGDSTNGAYATISGGIYNRAMLDESFVGGGRSNMARDFNTVVVGGKADTAYGQYSAVVGGHNNIAGSLYDTAAFVGGGENNKATSSFATVGGGTGNNTTGNRSVIGGGRNNTVSSTYGVIAGGNTNSVSGASSVVCGGGVNNVFNSNAGIVSGWDNAVSGYRGFIGAGAWNRANNDYNVVGGGSHNTTSAIYGVIGGGQENSNSGQFAVIPGGFRDTLTANASHAMAFGNSVYLNNSYRVAFFDGANSGRLGLNRDDHDGGVSYPVHVGTNSFNGNGAHLTNGGVWTNASSREFKENFQPVDGQDMLERINNLSMESWEYKGTGERHIWPCAEDFHEQFDIGAQNDNSARDTKYLAAGDVAGVALVGVKALYQKTKKIEELEARIAQLEAMVEMLVAQKQAAPTDNLVLGMNTRDK